MGRAATTKAPRASARRASTRRSDEASPAKRARGDDAASGGRDDDDGDGDDDGDDDASDDANDANDANDAGRGGPASVAGTREARVDDDDEGEGGTGRASDAAADAAAGERRRAPISIKAPPLLEEQISRLSEVETRKVLGRWNARLRGLKRRVQDISHQFPTSSLVLVFTKPFRSKDKRGKWAEEEFMARGPITRSRTNRPADAEGASLSGLQLLRRTVAEILGHSMNATQLARGAIDEVAAERFYQNERLVAEEPALGDTLAGLFEELKELVPAQLHPLCAHVLTRSKAVQKTGTAAELRVVHLAEDFTQRRDRERRPRTMDEAMALMNEIVGANSS